MKLSNPWGPAWAVITRANILLSCEVAKVPVTPPLTGSGLSCAAGPRQGSHADIRYVKYRHRKLVRYDERHARPGGDPRDSRPAHRAHRPDGHADLAVRGA